MGTITLEMLQKMSQLRLKFNFCLKRNWPHLDSFENQIKILLKYDNDNNNKMIILLN